MFPSLTAFLRSKGSGMGATLIEKLLERKSSGSGLEIRDYGRKGSAALTTRHPSNPQKLALTLPTSGGRSVGIVRSRTQATEFSFSLCVCVCACVRVESVPVWCLHPMRMCTMHIPQSTYT
jgi:hypothetical protein